MRSPLEQDMSKGFVVWFTGLSGAGKSTIAAALQAELARRGRSSELLDGDEVRGQTPNFVEVFVRCPLDTLVERDTKGLYRKAIAGEIANFTGVSDPYEEPLHPEVVCDTSVESPAQSVTKVLDQLERLGYLPRRPFERLPSGD